MPHPADNPPNSRSMALNSRVATRTAIRTAVRNFESIARNPLLESPDVDPASKTTISNGQLLQWDINKGASNVGAFTNVSPQSVNVTTSPITKEFFIKQGGSDSNGGTTVDDALLTFQRALYLSSRSDAYDIVTFYVKGDVVFNPADPALPDQNRLREGSFGGNMSRGIVIRGLQSNFTTPLTSASLPRLVPSQLVAGTALPGGTFTENATYSLGTTVRYDLSATPPAVVPFYRDTNNNYFPVAFDTSTNDGFDPATRRRVYMSDAVALPNVALQLQPYTFAGKVTMNNGGIVTNPGFSMTGNIQFVELEFVLQDGVVTPYHVNGEFVILYSKFSKTTGASGATLELSNLGAAADHMSTLRIDPANSDSAGGRIIQVYKSLFEDLTIKFDTTCEVKDSVFINCIIQNPHNVELVGCTFYNSAGIVVGTDTDTFSFRSGVKFDTCQFVYGAAATSHFIISDDSSIELKDIFSRPRAQNTDTQTVPFIVTSEDSTVNIINLKMRDGLNQTSVAAVINAGGGVMDVEGLNAVTTGNLPLLYASGGKVSLGDISDDTSNSGPLILTDSSNVSINDFVVNDGKYTVAGGSVFGFNSTSVKLNGVFGYFQNAGITSTTSVFELNNSAFKNYPLGSGVGQFNIQNTETQHAMIIKGSKVTLGIGINSPQVDIHGGFDIVNSDFLISAAADTAFKLDYQALNGVPTVDAINSKVTIKNLDIISAAGQSIAIEASQNSDVALTSCNVNTIGYTGKSTILLNNSKLSVLKGNINVTNADNKPTISLINGSTFNYAKDGGTAVLTAGLNSTNALSVDSGSVANLNEVTVTAARPQAILVDNGSTLVLKGTNGGAQSVTASATTGPTDEVIEVTNNSDATVEDIQLVSATSGSGASGIKVHRLARLYGKTLTGSQLHADYGVNLDLGARSHLTATNTGLSGTGFTIGATQHNWSVLTGGQNMVPDGAIMGNASNFNLTKNCVITYQA